MVNDKNHLYTTEDLIKDKKQIDKSRTQQQYSRFSVTEPNAINQATANAPPIALQIQTKPQIGDPINDTIGTIGATTQIISLDVFGSNYSTMIINGDVTFAFNKIPQGRHIIFTIDFVIDTVTPPTITLDPRVINPPALPTMTDGLRVVLTFEGVVDDVSTRFTYLSGTVGTTGGVTFPIDFPELDGGSVTGAVAVNFSESTRHARKYTMTGDITFSFTNTPANETAYSNIIVVQDGTGGHSVTLPVGTINKAEVEAGILQQPNDETGIVIKFSFGTVYAFLETGNTVSGGAGGGMNTDMSNMIDPTVPPVSLKMNDQDILEVKNLDFDSATSSIFDLVNLNFFQSGQAIVSVAGELDYNVPAVDFHKFVAGGVEIARFEEITAGVYRLDMKDHAIKDAKDIAFDGGASFSGSGAIPTIGYDLGDTDFIFNAPNVAEFSFKHNNIETMALSSGNLTFKDGVLVIFNPNATNAGVNVGLAVGDPSATTNGDLWYNSSTNKFRGKENGINVDIAASANSITQGDSNVTVTDVGTGLVTIAVDGATRFSVQATRVDVEDLPMFGLTSLAFTNASSTRTTLTQNATDFTLNLVNATDIYNLNFNGTVGLSIDSIRTRVHSTTPNTVSANLSLFRDDPSPLADDAVADIDFDGRDSAGNFTTYASWIAGIESPTSAAEKGRMTLQLQDSGSLVQAMRIELGKLTLNKASSVAAEFVEVAMIKADTTPGNGDAVAEIKHQIDDTGVITTYGSVRTEIIDATNAGAIILKALANGSLLTAMSLIGDDNNQRFMALLGGTDQARIQPALGQMGYFVTTQVTDFSLIIGTAGSLEIPQINDGSPSVTDLNQAFGAFDGAIGHDIADGKLYVRKSATVWSFYSESGTVT